MSKSFWQRVKDVFRFRPEVHVAKQKRDAWSLVGVTTDDVQQAEATLVQFQPRDLSLGRDHVTPQERMARRRQIKGLR